MHRLNRRLACPLVLLAACAAAASERAAAKEPPPACHACGGTCGLAPVCHCTTETKQRTRTTYDIRCEPVCVPGGGDCLFGGGGCGAAGSTVRLKKTLVKKVVDEEVRGVKHEVKYVCRHCAGGACASCTGLVAHAPADGSAFRWAGWLDLLGLR